jgi:hypothetical protein
MKHLYPLTIGILAMAIAAPATARVSGVSVPGPYPHTPSQSSATSSPLIVNTRLAAKSYYKYLNGQFTAVDSFRYTYSNGRGGSPEELDLNDDGVMFDESIRYTFNAGTAINNMKRVQMYGVDNRVEMLYYKPWETPLQNWQDSIRYVYKYNGQSNRIMSASLQIASQVDPNNPWPYGNNILYSNTYSNSGYILGIYGVTQNIFFAYDAGNNLICREVAVSNSWHSSSKDSFLYDASGRVSYTVHQVYDVGSADWVNDTRTTYTYNTAAVVPDYSVFEQWDAANASWQKKEKHLFTYDVAGNKLSDVKQIWSQAGYTNASRIDWTYNYNSQITYMATKTWNNTTGAWISMSGDYQRFFYYETYFPTSIKDLSDVVVNMNLFPSPAQDAVHFSIDWRTPQAFSMSVTDMQGRTMQQWSEQATNTYERTLDVSQWPSGNYLLTVAGTKGQATKRFVVAR